MKKTTQSHEQTLRWHDVSMAARSPETRSELARVFRNTNNLVEACTRVEDLLEFKKGKTAAQERARLREVRRIGEGQG